MEGGGEGAEHQPSEAPGTDEAETGKPEAGGTQEPGHSVIPPAAEQPAPAAPAEELAASPREPVAAEPAAQAEAAPPTDEPPPPRRRAWLWAAVVLVGAAIVGLVIGATLGGRQGGPLSGQIGGNGRPTIVVGTAAVSPSTVANVPSPSPSAVLAGATAVSSNATTYVVQPGDTLRSIADQEYGDASLWPKIYQANRDVIGADPDALVAGTTLQIPPP